MNEVENYNKNIFESIKHTDEKHMNIGMQENFKKYLNILSGEGLRKLFKELK